MINTKKENIEQIVKNQTFSYVEKLKDILKFIDSYKISCFIDMILEMKSAGGVLYICGNGGSAANAMHLANDFTFGISPDGNSIKVEALPANSSVITCLANDIGYENIFSHQLKVKANSSDLLLVLSGSGNSANIISALAQARNIGMKTIAILGFDGGIANKHTDLSFHIPVMDMQISEDSQLIIGHIIMQSLCTIIEVED